ncbi:MAG: S8 family serine peptidase, partial [Gammaproteobacteria bacterium]|nr:S8 family serine peptidase [Gammaproteobacteria bacterium]NIW49299.1 S8 family serine peptidase [Gammaproteobacteria bacterium]NIX59824.1 S8 family serine peptidase [candidate division Zixibacteria bacterium]
TGAGKIVMNIDTGVDGNHPALNYKWRGSHVPASQAWFDPDGSSFPFDNDSHGTHTMGIMTGIDPTTNDTVGVAPGAEWIAARTIGPSGNFQSNNVAAYQWAMDPDGNPGTTEDMPVAIGCSWRDPYVSYCDATYQMTFNSVEAAGIAIVFSAGNGYAPGPSITTPKNINTTLVNSFATGALDGNNPNLPIANFSSRGPSQCGGTGSLLIKPEACAPGDDVRSSIPGGSYGLKSGTSMACPHVVGAIALLKEAHPTLTGHEIKMALYLTAKETPSDVTPGEDNDYGMGIIDVYAAHMSLADPDDPNAPENISAYSDYTTPNSITLNWTDPTTYVNGNPLTNFQIKVYRDSIFVTNVASGVETYIDIALNDGQLYEYTLYAADIPNDSLSIPAEVSWTAGGAGQPMPPTNHAITNPGGGMLRAHWINPSDNTDGTPMDDLAEINLYENAVLLTTFTVSSADTGKADSADFTPSSGTNQYYVTAVDNETPPNESDPSNTAFSPLGLPFFDDFPTAGVPNPGFWINVDGEVTTNAMNPPAPTPTVLQLDGHPNGGDFVTLLPVDLTAAQGQGYLLSFHYQPQGIGNAPESGDSLAVDFLNDLGQWKTVRAWPGTGVVPFVNEIISIDSENPGPGATFFHSAFQFRFRNMGTSSSTSHFDLWLIDNVFLGPPTANPEMTVTPQTLSDTLLIGEMSTHNATISNMQTAPSTLSYTVTESPSVTWVNVTPTSGSIASGQSEVLDVTLDATGLTAGTYTTDIIISGNDTTNTQDTVAVTLIANEAPIMTIFPDTFDVSVASGDSAKDTLTVYNTGNGPLNYEVVVGGDLPELMYYKFNEAGSNQTQNFAAPGTPVPQWANVLGGLTMGGSGFEGSALIGSGGSSSTDYVDTGWITNLGSGSWTISMWLNNMDMSTTLRYHFGDNTASSFRCFSGGVAGAGNLMVRGGGLSDVQITGVGPGPSIVDVVYDDAAGEVRAYLNGVLNNTVAQTGVSIVGTANFKVGGYSTSNCIASGELMDEFKMFNRPIDVVTTNQDFWLRANPTAGSVPAGDSAEVEFTFDPTGLLGGDYDTEVLVTGNDPVNA